MKNIHRTVTVVELGKSVPASDLKLPCTDSVEVIDLTTRTILHIKAASVSMYRHTLRLHGKNYNILNIREFV